MSRNARTERKNIARKKIVRAIGLMTATLGMIVAAGILSLGSTLERFLERQSPSPPQEQENVAKSAVPPSGPATPSMPPALPELAEIGNRPKTFAAHPEDPYARILRGQKIVSLAETEPDALGNLTRVTIVRTSLKYPLIRVEDRLRRDSSNQEVLLARTAMVADHLMLSLGPELTEDDLLRAVSRLNREDPEAHYEIRRTNPNSKVYLLAFDGSSAQALNRAREQLLGARIAGTVEPDYLVHSR
ncbi:MAG: hypothetical protein NDJ89_11760 [Oligoflexia bacterium]|nr:hypothetical protein [Oligoflexia bacterium]